MSLRRQAYVHARVALSLAVVVIVAGCSGSPEASAAAENLPDLAPQGLEQIDCADSVVWAGQLESVKRPYVQECWTGSPALPFDEEADDIQYAILAASDGEDATSLVCPEDALYDTAAVACRAVVDGEILYRTVVALADPAPVVGALPDAPTEEQIDEVLAGARVEILMATEPATEE